MRAILGLLEFLLWSVLVRSALHRIPFLALGRVLFAVWFTPIGGGVWLYSKAVGPFLAKKEAEIDEGLTKLKRTASMKVSDLGFKAKTYASDKLSRLISGDSEK